MNAPSLPQSQSPTVVLVHGAFADSSSWNGVVAELKRRGYPVIAVANPLRGLREDAHYLRSVIDNLSGPIVLAGHSYGGSVMSEAAEGASAVTALVYIASFTLEVGESTAELAGKFPGASSAPHSIRCRSPPLTAAPAPTCTSNRTSSTRCSPPTWRSTSRS